MPVQDFGDFELYYEVHGSGTPLMLVPGLAGVGAYWKPQIEALADDYMVVIHDHRGCGRSSKSRITYSIEQMTEDMLRLMDALDIQRAHFVGHSTGGAMGQIMGIEHGDRLLSLMLANTWTKACAFRRRLMATRKEMLRNNDPAAYVRAVPLFLFPSWWIRDNEERLEQDAGRQIANFPPAEIQISRIDAGLAFDRTAELHRITTPTYVVGARDDHLTPAYYSRELAELIRGARLDILDTGAHCCSVTTPDVFNAALRTFLNAHERRSAR